MVVKEPCGICQKTVAKNHRAIECEICKNWIHIKCNFVSKDFYNSLIDENQDVNLSNENKTKWMCINCTNSDIPFSKIDDKSLYLLAKGVDCQIDLENISFKLDAKSKQLVQQLSNLISETHISRNSNFKFLLLL